LPARVSGPSTKEAGHARCAHGDKPRDTGAADIVTVSPLRLVHSCREQQEAKRTHVLAERILAVMRQRQADARTELLFSTELLTKSAWAEPAWVFRALGKLDRDHLIFREDMTGRCILADKPLLKRQSRPGTTHGGPSLAASLER
jgi:hypothetical protein